MSFGNGSTTFATAMYGYDPTGRVETVGNATDTLTYAYVPGTGDIASSSWQTATLDTAYTYDGYKRLTNIAVNNVNVYGYTLNDKNQRTGATLSDGNTWSYSYDTLGQLTGAEKNSSAAALLKTFTYSYDLIGNRTSATEDDTTTSYTSNLVNQYTQIAAQIPTYDADGNLLTCNGWTYTWNGENRLIAAESSDTKLEFSYDYMGRRIEKKVYTRGLLSLYEWTLQSHRKFVYDGYKLIAEFDVEDDNTTLLASYLWQPVGLDVPLMRIADNAEEYYIVDGNKNVIALKDSSGADIAAYTYTPFGAVEDPVDGDENPFRFSSEYHDDETSFVYYNYRYYSPALGRWINRDPIEEEGGVNLYATIFNDCIDNFDALGLKSNGGLSAFTAALDKNMELLNNYKCTFVIAADKDDLDLAWYDWRTPKYVPSQVVKEVKKILRSKFKKNCLNIITLSVHTSVQLINALEKYKCICGFVYIGHASTNPSRMIFNTKDSLAVTDARQSLSSARKPYTKLPATNILPGNTSAIFGCQSSVGGEQSIANKVSKHFNGTVVGADGKLNFDGGDPYSPDGSGFTAYSTVNNDTLSVPSECCCNKSEKATP